jgi:VanZ family protein
MKKIIILNGDLYSDEELTIRSLPFWMSRDLCGHTSAGKRRAKAKRTEKKSDEEKGVENWLPTAIFLVYLAFLTALLMTPNPVLLVGLKRIPLLPWGDNGIHFCFLTGFAALAYAVRWPKQIHWLTVALLLAYGFSAETMQYFVPPRAVELKDYVENFMGIVAGTAIYWTLQRIWQVRGESKLAMRRG